MPRAAAARRPAARDLAPPLTALAGIADLFLTHNRPIHVRCDDSVTRVVDGVEQPVRMPERPSALSASKARPPL